MGGEGINLSMCTNIMSMGDWVMEIGKPWLVGRKGAFDRSFSNVEKCTEGKLVKRTVS